MLYNLQHLNDDNTVIEKKSNVTIYPVIWWDNRCWANIGKLGLDRFNKRIENFVIELVDFSEISIQPKFFLLV